jgi:hypothetical protein
VLQDDDNNDGVDDDDIDDDISDGNGDDVSKLEDMRSVRYITL